MWGNARVKMEGRRQVFRGKGRMGGEHGAELSRHIGAAVNEDNEWITIVDNEGHMYDY